jgi:SAM-dependent methyltransferase
MGIGPAEPIREQRLVFGEVADVYDRLRPSYPAALVDAILTFADLDGSDRAHPVAEVGAGTGKASVLFAARGLQLTCIEPSPNMAALAMENLKGFPAAEVLQTSFEDWQPVPHTFGLLYAAQSWHWVSPGGRYAKAEHALRPQGTVALFWNVIARRGDESLDRDLEKAYGGLIPNARWSADQAKRLEANNWVANEIKASGLFGPVTVVREPHSSTYDTDTWLDLLSTQSDHRMLAEDERAGLFHRIRHAVDANGRSVEVAYVSVAYLARTRGRHGRRPR